VIGVVILNKLKLNWRINNLSDYIFPNKLAKVLRSPSQRTTMEATLVGYTGFILTSLATTVYMLFFTELGLFWKVLSGIGEICLFLLLSSQLVSAYIQYYTFKKNMGMYPPDRELEMKVMEAKDINRDLNELINRIEKGGKNE